MMKQIKEFNTRAAFLIKRNKELTRKHMVLKLSGGKKVVILIQWADLLQLSWNTLRDTKIKWVNAKDVENWEAIASNLNKQLWLISDALDNYERLIDKANTTRWERLKIRLWMLVGYDEDGKLIWPPY